MDLRDGMDLILAKGMCPSRWCHKRSVGMLLSVIRDAGKFKVALEQATIESVLLIGETCIDFTKTSTTSQGNVEVELVDVEKEKLTK